MATTSFRAIASSSIITLITLLPATFTDTFFIPTKENSRVGPDFTATEYFPSKSVIVPLDVPFTITLAPITGSPSESVTTPVTRETCCNASTTANFPAAIPSTEYAEKASMHTPVRKQSKNLVG